jgi:ABC-type antimicrobial peptide transport system permease subunit
MFKPKTYFDFSWWVWLGAIGFGMLFCLLGTVFPSNRAAKMEPAHALVVQ